MPMSGKIIDLRNLLANRFPRAPKSVGTRLITGLAFFDQSVGGGLPKGAITELITPPRSAGSASLVHAFIHGAYRDKYFVALIDGHDSFDPCALGNSILRQLLWVRCAKALEAVKAADLARWQFPAADCRSDFQFSGRIAQNSANNLVSLATTGRISAHGVSGAHPV